MPLDLSIIIVNWNAREYLLRAIESIVATCRRHTFEVIVVDNASTDGSPDAVAARFPETLLIRNEQNLGFARGNNAGIARARGRHVALVNSDAEALPGCLDCLLDMLDARPDLGMIGPRVLNGDGTIQHSHWDFPTMGRALARMLALDTLGRKWKSSECGLQLAPSENTGRAEARTPNRVDILSGCFMVLRREALEQVGLLDEGYYMYGEDMDLCRRFHDAGWGVGLDPGARAIHFGGASSAAAPVRFFLELQRANLRYWLKHHGRAGGAFFLGITFIHHLLRLVPRIIIYLVVPRLRIPIRHKIERSTACLKWILHRPGSGAA